MGKPTSTATEYIGAGMLEKFSQFLKGTSKGLHKAVSDLIEDGAKIRSARVDNDITYYTMGGPDKHAIEGAVKIQNEKNPDIVDVHILANNGKKGSRRGLSTSEINNFIRKSVKKIFPNDKWSEWGNFVEEESEELNSDDTAGHTNPDSDNANAEEVEAATLFDKRITAKFKKITAGTETSVELVSIYSTEDPITTLAVINDVASDDSFVDQLTEEETVFSIVDEGNEYDISPDEDCSMPDTTYTDLLKEAYNLLLTIQTVFWNAKGKEFHNVRTECQNMMWSIRDQVDNIAELCIEHSKSVPDPRLLVECGCGLDTTDGFNEDDAFRILKEGCERFVSVLELYYCNLTADEQHLAEYWMRSWNRQNNFQLNQITRG